uniref:Uncharacterized protein n=1 Tax=Rhizophora mucronata TaxID=61149 RepID=A0A2P2IHN7_RHIMU
MGDEDIMRPHIMMDNAAHSTFFVKISQTSSCSNCNFLSC